MSRKVCILSPQEAERVEYNWSIGNFFRPNCANHAHCTRDDADVLKRQNRARQITLPRVPHGRCQYITYTIGKTWRKKYSGGMGVMQMVDESSLAFPPKKPRDRMGREPIKLGTKATFEGTSVRQFQR